VVSRNSNNDRSCEVMLRCLDCAVYGVVREGLCWTASVTLISRPPHLMVDVAYLLLDGKQEDILTVVAVVVLSSRTALTRSSLRQAGNLKSGTCSCAHDHQ